jgi:hypothetical protein
MRNGFLKRLFVLFAVFALAFRVTAPLTAAEATPFWNEPFCKALDLLLAVGLDEDGGAVGHAGALDCAVCDVLGAGTSGPPPVVLVLGAPLGTLAPPESPGPARPVTAPITRAQSRGPPSEIRSS